MLRKLWAVPSLVLDIPNSTKRTDNDGTIWVNHFIGNAT